MTSERSSNFQVEKFRFVGEQSGSPEQQLKVLLCSYFGNANVVERAYLARVSYNDGSEVHVALCLYTSRSDREATVRGVNALFAKIFAKEEHLDIVFLDSQQELALAKVCRPFFS